MDVFGNPVYFASAIIMAVGLAVLGVLAWVARAQRPAPDVDLGLLRAAARELADHAAAARVRAGRAAAAALEYRARAAAAVGARDVAWQVQETAERAHRELRQRVVAGRRAGEPRVDATVTRAALSAYRRGDISVDELREVWTRTDHRDAAQVQLDEEAATAAAAEREARRGFDRAAARARRAEQDAWVAEVAARALADEAADAAAEAHEALLAVEIRGRR